MIINRHNYEEFFLLYVDNELQDTDRASVENFVQQNPDLAQELEMLSMVRLENNILAFAQKEILYKKETGISLSNYQEYFLLSVDKELNRQETAEVERFVLKHPELQQEYTLLQQTQLEPPTLFFAKKEQLYKTEKKERRVIPLFWMRMSVAAAIFGLVAGAWFLNNPKSVETTVPVRLGNKTVKQQPSQLAKQTPLQPIKENAVIAPKEESKKEVKGLAMTNIPVKKKNRQIVTIKKNEIPAIKLKEQNKTDQVEESSNLAVQEEKMAEQKRSLPAIANVEKNISKQEDQKVNEAALVHTVVAKEETMTVSNAVYREIDNSEEERSFYIGNTEINKNKLKGLFKKAASLFERKTAKRENEKTLRIAGFEIKS